jgi:hypothetical protein
MPNLFRAIGDFYQDTIAFLENEGFSSRYSRLLTKTIVISGVMFGTLLTIAIFSIYPTGNTIVWASWLQGICRWFAINPKGAYAVLHLVGVVFLLTHTPIGLMIGYQKVRTRYLIQRYRRKEKKLFKP